MAWTRRNQHNCTRCQIRKPSGSIWPSAGQGNKFSSKTIPRVKWVHLLNRLLKLENNKSTWEWHDQNAILKRLHFFAPKMGICLDPASDARSDGISCCSTGALRELQQHPPERLWQQLPWPECVPVKTHLWIHTTYSLWCRSRPAASCPSPSATLSVTVSLFKYSGHRRLAKAIRFNPFGFSLALMLHEQCWY